MATRTKIIKVCDWCGRDGSSFYVQSYNFMIKDQDSHGKTEYDLKSIDLCEYHQQIAYKMLIKGVEK